MILVTGAAGRLGQRVVQRLVERGDAVVGTDARALDDTPSRFVQTDLCDTARVTDLVAQADAVIHMGAIPSPRQSEPYEIYRNNGQSIRPGHQVKNSSAHASSFAFFTFTFPFSQRDADGQDTNRRNRSRLLLPKLSHRQMA